MLTAVARPREVSGRATGVGRAGHSARSPVSAVHFGRRGILAVLPRRESCFSRSRHRPAAAMRSGPFTRFMAARCRPPRACVRPKRSSLDTRAAAARTSRPRTPAPGGHDPGERGSRQAPTGRRCDPPRTQREISCGQHTAVAAQGRITRKAIAVTTRPKTTHRLLGAAAPQGRRLGYTVTLRPVQLRPRPLARGPGTLRCPPFTTAARAPVTHGRARPLPRPT